MILRDLKGRFLSLLLAALLSPMSSYGSVKNFSCNELIASSTDSLKHLVNQLRTYSESVFDGEYTPQQLETFKKKFYPELQALLENQGLKIKWNEKGHKGFEILPEGQHLLSRLAKALKKYEIILKVSPELWTYGAAASAHEGVINIDFKSLEERRLTPTLAHEIRHAMNEVWSQQEQNEFERKFQVTLDATMTEQRLIPGEKNGMYSGRYSLDEILAYRQSVFRWIRELKRSVQKDTSTREALYQIKSQVKILLRFSRSWLANAPILEKEIRAGHFTYDFPDKSGDRAFENLSFTITRPSHFEMLLRRSAVDPLFIGISVKLLVSQKERNDVRSKRAAKNLILKKLLETTAEVARVEPLIMNLDEAVRAFDGEDVEALENTLSMISDLH